MPHEVLERVEKRISSAIRELRAFAELHKRDEKHVACVTLAQHCEHELRNGLVSIMLAVRKIDELKKGKK